jgi:hypothetical protein
MGRFDNAQVGDKVAVSGIYDGFQYDSWFEGEIIRVMRTQIEVRIRAISYAPPESSLVLKFNRKTGTAVGEPSFSFRGKWATPLDDEHRERIVAHSRKWRDQRYRREIRRLIETYLDGMEGQELAELLGNMRLIFANADKQGD